VFEGSSRQVRGAVVRSLSEHGSLSISELSRHTGSDVQRLRQAVEALAVDGIVERTDRGHLQLKA
jgi:predicted transcriptional regulator